MKRNASICISGLFLQAEETQCLILRCLDDVRDYEDHKDNYSRLYVMVGVEHLTYVTQIKLIEQLHHLQASKDLPYAFAIVTQDKHNRVVSRMREFERDPGVWWFFGLHFFLESATTKTIVFWVFLRAFLLFVFFLYQTFIAH